MKRMLVVAGLTAAALAIGVGAAVAADLIVVQSRGIRLAPGQSIDGTKPLTLLDGQQVTLLSSSGQIVKLEGPSQAAPDSQVSNTAATGSNAVAALITERQARTSEVGIVRGEGDVKLPNPWVVDVTHPGTSCVQTGRPVVLWRSSDLGETAVSIAPSDRSWSVSGRWPSGANELSMPANMPLHDQTSYDVIVGGPARAPVTVRLIPASVENDAMRASWMAEVGCDNQANALLALAKK